MAEGLRDKYANIMTFSAQEPASGTINFSEVQTNVGIDSSRKTGVAILIDEIDYFPSAATIELMTVSGDDLEMGITISSAVTNLLNMTDRRILHSAKLHRFDFGTAGSGALIRVPMAHQFFPPLIMAERQIFLGVISAGLASGAIVDARIYYRTVQITAEEFVEIAEVFRLVS